MSDFSNISDCTGYIHQIFGDLSDTSYSPLAQLVERETVNLEAAGSIPARRVSKSFGNSFHLLHFT